MGKSQHQQRYQGISHDHVTKSEESANLAIPFVRLYVHSSFYLVYTDRVAALSCSVEFLVYI